MCMTESSLLSLFQPTTTPKLSEYQFICDGMKKCSVCGTVKPHSEFYVRNKARGVPHSCCKSCDKAQKKDYYVENRDKIKERTKSWGITNPNRRSEIDRSSHLKTKFGITPEDYDRDRK